MYIGNWLERGERYWPEALAVVDLAKGEAGRFTYAALNRRANRFANWLRRVAGVGVGDRVAILAYNGVEYLDLFFASAKIGAIFVPYNWRNHWRELATQLRMTRPTVLVYAEEFAENVARALSDDQQPPIAITHLLHLDGNAIERSLHFDTVCAEQSAEPVSCELVAEEAIACLLFTGGTTGSPKAAQISHRMIAWNTLNTVIHELERGDITITHTPMFHTGGLLVYTLPLLTLGGTVVIMKKWSAPEMLQLIERENISILFCVPTQYQLMMNCSEFARTSFRKVRFLTSGGAPLPLPVLKAYRDRHGVAFKQGFGMTEFGPGVFSLAARFAESHAGSVGMPNYFVDAQIVDETNRPLPPEYVGELVLRGPVHCSGYYNDPRASSAAVDAEGWFHTGDLARMSRDGFYFIVDRKKDMFVSGGENVYPVEIENVLYEHPQVAQCAVIGIPDPSWGEAGHAIVVLKPGADTTPRELLDFCGERLARYKVPKQLVFADVLPMSAAGKILKRELVRNDGSR